VLQLIKNFKSFDQMASTDFNCFKLKDAESIVNLMINFIMVPDPAIRPTAKMVLNELDRLEQLVHSHSCSSQSMLDRIYLAKL
jgi:hypothetical protein